MNKPARAAKKRAAVKKRLSKGRGFDKKNLAAAMVELVDTQA